MINYISLKESFESIIKMNLMSLISISNENIKINNDAKEEINI